MTRLRMSIVTALLGAAAFTFSGAQPAATQTPAAATPLRILVTNDDGVGAPGIAVVVDVLQALPDVEVTVVAPATNQSGSGDTFSTGPITVAPATTASGDPATAVSGRPADSVLYALLVGLPQPPHIVVSGSNFGQNLGNIAEDISGTVGAARTANWLGIPALALSNGLGSNIKYSTAASAAAFWIAAFRKEYLNGNVEPTTLNVNVPTCPSGNPRGIVVVPLGRSQRVTGYTLQSGSVGNGTFQPTLVNQNPISTPNCRSTLTKPADDIEAFNNGFITLTVMTPDLTKR